MTDQGQVGLGALLRSPAAVLVVASLAFMLAQPAARAQAALPQNAPSASGPALPPVPAFTAVRVPAATGDSVKAAFARHFPGMGVVDEVRTTPIAGLFELRIGADVFYATAGVEYVIQGDLIEGRTGASLTQQRIHQLTAIDPSRLNTADAVTWTRGKGERRLFVFADPNCGPCRRFESEVSKMDNLTVHTFIVPVLGGDSPRRSRDLWCASDRAAAWRAWMLDGKAAPAAAAGCSTQAIERNLALVERYRITGTPTIVLANGERLGGVPSTERLERDLTRTAR